MKHTTWQKSTTSEYRNPTWVRTDWLRGGSIERHDGTFGGSEYVKRDSFGKVTYRKKTQW